MSQWDDVALNKNKDSIIIIIIICRNKLLFSVEYSRLLGYKIYSN